MKIRLLILLILLVFFADTVFAAGTYTFNNPRPIANCGTTGSVIAYTIVATNFSGSFEGHFYVNDIETHREVSGVAGPASFTVPNHHVPASVADGPNPDDSVYRVFILINGTAALDISWVCSTGGVLGLSHPFTDGRINRFDGAAPIAVYANSEGIQIWEIDANSEGHLVLSISLTEIEAVGIPSENTLLGTSEDGRITVWRLPNGEFQIVAPTPSGKTYYLFFSVLGNDVGYSSYES